MKRTGLQDMTVDELVERFLAIALGQSEAIAYDDSPKFRKLFRQEIDVVAELMLRAGDQRHALMPLYGHPNPQVRYAAASVTKDIAPQEVRRVCEIISERNEYPQAANARGLLRNLDEGQTDLSWILEAARKNRLQP
jgi:hypothetical protein